MHVCLYDTDWASIQHKTNFEGYLFTEASHNNYTHTQNCFISCRGNDSDEEDESRNPQTKSEVCWGLSKSSCNLAKELLSAPQLSLTESEENLLVFAKVESKSSSQECEEEGEKTADVRKSHTHTHVHSQKQSVHIKHALMYTSLSLSLSLPLIHNTHTHAHSHDVIHITPPPSSGVGLRGQSWTSIGSPRQEASQTTAQDPRREAMHSVHGWTNLLCLLSLWSLRGLQ